SGDKKTESKEEVHESAAAGKEENPEYAAAGKEVSETAAGNGKAHEAEASGDDEVLEFEASGIDFSEASVSDTESGENHSTNKAADTKSILAILRERKTVDVDQGILYCGMDEDFFIEIVREYIEAYDSKKKVLDTALENENWHEFRISVHALKSTSKTIGATELTEKAFKFEKAAENEDAAFIKENYQSFINEYTALKNTLAEITG
ncbi:MAG: Hpt domain-containing protein, partial [Lachnospiraceae bacterium]|nr:Hpt domain-containing protein [Lachnospiraceae bacterium]